MADFNDFNRKASDFAAAAVGKARDLAAVATDKAKKAGRIAKLNLDITSEKETIRRAYGDIGKLYYETHKDAPEGFFVQLVEEINTANAAIAQKEAEIATLRQESTGTQYADADFETVVSDTESEADTSKEAPADESEDKPEE